VGADKKVQRLTERTAKASCFFLYDSRSSLHTSFSSG